ncbi:MAG: tetratricopeptide repeat protein [Calditrichia bacterium]
MILILILLPDFAAAERDEIQSTFQQANAAYRAENYAAAIDLYRQILNQGYQSADLYYNLGNSYYRRNEIGEAILFYNKAKKLNPRDPDIQYNLEIANLKVIDRIKMPERFFLFEWWDEVKYFFSIYNLTYLVLSLFTVVILFIILRFFTRSWGLRRGLLWLAGITGIVMLFWAYILLIRFQDYHSNRQAVLLEPAASVFSAPDDNSTQVFVLHEGVTVELEEQRDTWMKISLPDGKSGWLNSDKIGII